MPEWQLALFLVASGMGVAGCLWAAWCEFPVYAWNDLRLAPAFALRHGIDPYPPPGGGPLSTWIYGPVGILVNLPATFAPTALAALQSASLINAAVVIGPLALIFFASSELRARRLAIPFLALLVAILFIPRPNLVLQVADHAAIAAGLLASWLLARPRFPSGLTLAAAAALTAIAVWSKQIALFLVLGQVIYLVMASGKATAFRYVAWVALFGFVALGVFVAAFGFANLWFNLVEIPGNLPWAEFKPRLIQRPAALVTQILIPALGLWALWQRGLWPDRGKESGRFFQVATLAAAVMLPIGLIGFFKIGGDTNLLHSWDYLLPAGLLLLFAQDHGTRTALRVTLVVVAGLLLRREDLFRIHPRPLTGQYAAAEALFATQPGKLWFPQNPVLTFYANGRLWHTEDGVATRYLANHGIREPDFRRHLPPDFQAVVYPSVMTHPFVMALLPDFTQEIRLPFWVIHTRSSPTPTQATPSVPQP